MRERERKLEISQLHKEVTRKHPLSSSHISPSVVNNTPYLSIALPSLCEADPLSFAVGDGEEEEEVTKDISSINDIKDVPCKKYNLWEDFLQKLNLCSPVEDGLVSSYLPLPEGTSQDAISNSTLEEKAGVHSAVS